MNNEDLQQLKSLAMAATPGPWEAEDDEVWPVAEHEACHPIRGDGWRNFSCRLPEQLTDDASFIAAANPATILALIARIESLAADAERYQVARSNSEQYYFAYRNPERGYAFSQVHGKEMDKVVDAIAKEKA